MDIPSGAMGSTEQYTHPHDLDDDEVRTKENSAEAGKDPETGLKKVMSRITSRTSYVDPGPPDGGLQAWTQSLVGHLVVFNTWGLINSFGVFQTYYIIALNRPPSDISWIGSIQIFLLFFVGTFSGRATDYGLFKTTFILGSILQLVGVFMTSLSTRYWQLILSQGITTGLGNGLLFCPSLAVLSTYFSSKRAVAIAIAASGSATGGLVFPVIVQQLLPKIGFGWTVRVLAFVMLGLQTIAFVLAKPRLPPRKAGPIVEWAAFGELPYTLFAIGMFLAFWGLYFAFYYVGSFGRDVLGISQKESVNNLLIMNGVGLVGRMVPAYFADRYFGPLNSLIPFVFVSGLLVFCWAAVTSQSGLTAFAVVYGLFAAGIQSLFPATTSSLTIDMKKTDSHATPMQPFRFVNIFRLHAESVKSDGPVTGQRIVLAIPTKNRTIQHDVGTEIFSYGNVRYYTYSISFISVVECDKPLDTAADMVKTTELVDPQRGLQGDKHLQDLVQRGGKIVGDINTLTAQTWPSIHFFKLSEANRKRVTVLKDGGKLKTLKDTLRIIRFDLVAGLSIVSVYVTIVLGFFSRGLYGAMLTLPLARRR
ncbi:MAG: hypothetical protein Q9173_003784, partial [Seirophora scorigena]